MNAISAGSDCHVDAVIDDERHTTQREFAQAFGFAHQVAGGHVRFAQLDHVDTARKRRDDDIFQAAIAVARAVGDDEQQWSRRQTVLAGHGSSPWT